MCGGMMDLNLTYDELSEQLGISRNAARVLVHAAAEENPIDHAARGRPAMVQRNGLAMVRL
jgi:predicted ArsR family transcriptional regulator